jgi:HEAT repeat protein
MLQALSQDFDGHASENRRLIRDLAEQDWRLFYSAGVEILKNQHDSPCGIYVIKLLMGRNLLIDALCDPALSREQAMAVARAASRIDCMTDVVLAKFLADRETSDHAVRPAELMRLMEIMVEVSNFARILPVLKRMSRHPNPQIRSKAVLMIGRGNPTSGWLQNRFAESDPRIRANTVEALWGVDTEDARGLLLAAARDDNNRVVGNALLALHRLGESSAEPQLRKMAESESAAFRATCAWVIGEIADPRFASVLAGLLGDSSPMVRKRAFSALGKVSARTRAAHAIPRPGCGDKLSPPSPSPAAPASEPAGP